MWSKWAHIQHLKSIFKLHNSPVVFVLPFLRPCMIYNCETRPLIFIFSIFVLTICSFLDSNDECIIVFQRKRMAHSASDKPQKDEHQLRHLSRFHSLHHFDGFWICRRFLRLWIGSNIGGWKRKSEDFRPNERLFIQDGLKGLIYSWNNSLLNSVPKCPCQFEYKLKPSH